MPFPFLSALGSFASVVGGIGQASASQKAAAAQMRGAVIERKVANENAKVLQAQAGRLRENAKLEEWRGQYVASRISQQNAINQRLADADYFESTRAADIVELSNQRGKQFSDAKAAQFDLEAQNIASAATTSAARMYRQGKTTLGQQRIATARSGLRLAGTELDRLVESATRLELDRFDMLTEAGNRVRQTKFAGTMTRFEGDMAAFQGAENVRGMRYAAELGKFNSRVDAWNSEQEAAIALYESQLNAKNIRSQASDLAIQAKLTKRYGAAAYQGATATAAAMRAQGGLSVLSGIGDAAINTANFRNR